MWSRLDPQIGILNRGLDVSQFRHNLIADNIANADTPGYKRKDVNFAEIMNQATGRSSAAGLRVTHPEHLSGSVSSAGDVQAVQAEGTSTRLDGNNVDIEVEMAQMAANSLYYQTAGHLLSARYGILERIINTGRP